MATGWSVLAFTVQGGLVAGRSVRRNVGYVCRRSASSRTMHPFSLPREITWYRAPGNSMPNGRAMLRSDDARAKCRNTNPDLPVATRGIERIMEDAEATVGDG